MKHFQCDLFPEAESDLTWLESLLIFGFENKDVKIETPSLLRHKSFNMFEPVEKFEWIGDFLTSNIGKRGLLIGLEKALSGGSFFEQMRPERPTLKAFKLMVRRKINVLKNQQSLF